MDDVDRLSKEVNMAGAVRALSIGLLVAIVTISLCAPLVAPHHPLEIDMTNRLQEPSQGHLLGTDVVGRDVLSRLIYGGRSSLLIALWATAFTAVIATATGLIGGYFGGGIDTLVMLTTGLFHGIPGMAVLIAIAGVLGPGPVTLLLGLVVTAWPTFSRVMRSEALRIRHMPFVEDLRGLGASHARIISRHVVPNLAGPFLVLSATRMSAAIVAVSSLSFIGLGLPPPTPDWGVMIRDSLPYLRTQPLHLVAPGLTIVIVTLGLNSIADVIRGRG